MPLRSPLEILFVPADRFFMRVVPLVADEPAAAQIELALEGLAPFPLPHLYWGWCVSADGSRALVYAAHRRRFTAEETAGWERADAVVPDSLPRLADAADDAARAVLAANPPAEPRSGRAWRQRDQLMLELVGPDGAVGPAVSRPRAALADMDVRDRGMQVQYRRDRRQRDLVWRVALGAAAALALAALLDLAAAGLGLATKARAARVAERSAVVQKLDTLQSLTARVDEMTKGRLRFFEMLAVLNPVRPRSLQFTSVASEGRSGLVIEASTAMPEDADTFENALRDHPQVDHAEVRELRTREGVTTFTLEVGFKPEAAAPAPAATATAPAAKKEGGA